MDDLISRQKAIDGKIIIQRTNGVEIYYDEAVPVGYLKRLPTVQPDENAQEFIKLTVRNSNGRPYYSIIYLEYDKNGVGHDFVGYSSYSLDVISDYLKKYFMPPAQPDPHEGHWIKHESPDGGEQYECSECGVLWEFNDGTPEDNEAYFCPKCGAKMKGERQK